MTELPTYTAAEVAERNFKAGKDCWLIYKKAVYDVTDYVKSDEHPGGPDLVTDYAGKDCTKAFHDAGHSAEALKDFKKFKIGTLATDETTANKSNTKAPMSKEKQAKQQVKKRACFLFC